ncbi:aldehyde dehydrogenase, partial [Genlisea aurea]
VEELRSAYHSGRTRSLEWRASQLKALLKIATHHEEEILEALMSDLNKPKHEAYLFEIASVSSACKLAMKELPGWMMPEKVKTTMATFPSSAEIVSEPLGVVLVISTWNYPFLLSMEPVIGAIAAGNAVVLKPSEVAPSTSSLLSKLLGEYMDSTAVRVVEGGAQETISLLEQKWDKIFYTGNPTVGRTILAAAAKHLTPVVLELGGKCPVVVDSTTNIQVTARRIVSGKWGCNSGQTCVCPDYVITSRDYSLKLIDAISSELDNFCSGDPLQSDDSTRIVNSGHFERLVRLLEDPKISGKIVIGGKWDKAKLKISPTVIMDAPKDSLVMNEEIFGPLLPIITVEDIEESIAVINGKGNKPLAAYIFTRNEKLRDDFIRNVSAGSMAINDVNLQVVEPELPFGGVGESGMGCYHGKFSFDAFSHRKPVLDRHF